MKKKIFISIIFILLSTYLVITINKLNMLPITYNLAFISIISLINILAIIFMFLKNKILKVLSIILYLILLFISVIGIKYGQDTYNFINESFGNYTEEITIYNVIVKNNSKYKNIKDLKDKKIGYLENKKEKETLSKIKKSIEFKSIKGNDIFKLYDDLMNNKIDALIIDSAYLDIFEEEDVDVKVDSNIKTIYSFEIVRKVEKKEDVDTIRPVNIYISGSDSRTKNIVNKSRSDVNMLLTINPDTKEILMTSVPRDYYVQVHGQTGLKDKLTHSGIYGLETSTKTMEDLFNTKIDYSVKVNFNSVVELVDLIGGIEIDSDLSFKGSAGYSFKKGINKVNGKQALAYSRERHAYRSGDRHRITNQQQVLEGIINKITSDKSLLLKYDDLLKKMGNLYITDIPSCFISLLVKEQLNDMSSWTIKSQQINGSDASLPTHTSPGSNRYVMIPYKEDVIKAQKEINKVLKK